MGREPCHHSTSSVTWDSEEMVAEQRSSFHPNLRPFEQLTAAFQLCVCVQRLWSLIIHLSQYSCRKAYRARHVRVKLRCNNVLSRSTFTLRDQEWVQANTKAGWAWGVGDRSVVYQELISSPYINWSRLSIAAVLLAYFPPFFFFEKHSFLDVHSSPLALSRRKTQRLQLCLQLVPKAPLGWN